MKYLSLIALLLFVGFTNAQKGQAVIEPRGFNSLKLNIELSKSAFVPLEPIPIKFRLENDTSEPIVTHGNFDFNCNYVKIQITEPDDAVVEINKLSYLNGRSSTQNGSLPAGEKLEAQRLINFAMERYFDRPGQYRIKATFTSLDGKTVESEWTPFTIVEPTGNDLAAYQFLKKQKNLSTFLSGYTSDSFPNQKALVDSFPDSAYADYVRFVIVFSYLNAKDYIAAQEELLRLKSKPGFVFSDKVEEQLKNVGKDIGKH